MLEAALWGLLATSTLVIGAEVVFAVRLSRMVVGLFMAYDIGALIASVSFELLAPAMESSGTGRVALGLATGALVFLVGDVAIERAGEKRTSRKEQPVTALGEGESSLGIVLGTALDGIPESAALGMSLVGGGEVSTALLIGIWLANFPEALAATIGMQSSGWSTRMRRDS
jgi:ZIP family zinc transporter